MLTQLLFFALLIFISLGTRVLVYQFTPGFHEYESIFIYASDLLVLALIFLNFKRIKAAGSSYKLLIIFLSLAAVSIFFAASKGLAIYSLARLVIFVLLAMVIGELCARPKIFRSALIIISILAVLESFLGIYQFRVQNNLGLEILGESPIGVAVPGTSKILVEGAKLIRAYGTFPHPNIFGAFLVLGLVSLFYLYVKSLDSGEKPSSFKEFLRTFAAKRLVLVISIFLVAAGLTLTFSRSSWIGVIIATVMFLALVFREDIKSRAFDQSRNFWLPHSIRFLGIITVVAVFVLAALGWAVLPRAQVSWAERSITLRLDYNRLGLEIVNERPLGVGIGNQVLYAYERGLYEKFGMNKAAEWQPVHNLYLLISAEIGIIGLLIFLMFCGSLLIPNFKFLISKQTPNPNDQSSKIGNWKLEIGTSTIMLIALLVLGFFDHYFWTLEQGRLMLWVTIGLVLGVSSNKPS